MKIIIGTIITLLIGITPVFAAQWERINNGLWGSRAERIVGTEKVIYATTRYADDYYSTDKGMNWRKMNNSFDFEIINVKDDYVFARKSDGGFIVSYDMGLSWVKEKNMLTDSVVIAVEFIEEKVYAITLKGNIFTSSDNGITWNLFSESIKNDKAHAIKSVNGSIVVATYKGILVTSDYGKTWENSLSGIYNLKSDDKTILAYNEEIIQKSTNGKNWVDFRLLSYTSIRNVEIKGENIYVLCDQGFLAGSMNAGNIVHTSLPNGRVLSFKIINGVFYCLTFNVIYASDNDCKTWSERVTGMEYIGISAICKNNKNVYAYNGVEPRLFVSSDNGNNWNQYRYEIVNQGDLVEKIVANDSIIVLYTYHDTYISNDNGKSWRQVHDVKYIKDVLIVGSKIYLFNSELNYYVSSDGGRKWVLHEDMKDCVYFYTSAQNGNSVYVSAETAFYVSDDYGESWKAKKVPMNNELNIQCLAFDDENIYAGSFKGCIMFSSNKGDSWDILRKGEENEKITSIVFAHNILIALSRVKGIIFSTDKGITWNEINNGLHNNRVTNLISIDDYVFASTDLGMFRLDMSTLTSLEDNSERVSASPIMISPNPANDYCTVQLHTSTEQNLQYVLTSQLGEIVQQGIIPAHTHSYTIDIHTLPAGMYIFSMDVNGKRKQEKFIVMR